MNAIRRRFRLPHRVLPLAAIWLLHAGQALADPPVPGPASTPAVPAATQHMQVRVFEGFDGHGTGPKGRETPLAIDTDLQLVTCPDGNLQVTGMNIGGATYETGERGADCASGSRTGSVHFDDGQRREVTATAGPPAEPVEKPAPRCDPATWRCADPAPAPATVPGAR